MKYLARFFTLLLLPFWACNDNKPGDLPDFDRGELLHHYADNLIQPAYQSLQSEATDLLGAAEAFTTAPDEAALAALQLAWRNAYQSWQSANAYNFGPAGEAGLKKGLIEELGTFPTAEDKIEAAITAGDHTLASFDRDARGFLAMEYLIFGKTTDSADVLAQFVASPSRREHLLALAGQLKGLVDEVVADWATYEAAFVTNVGTDVGSSVSQLYNEFVRSFESIKNFKVGLPAGKRPGQTMPEPHLVEALYSSYSLEMLRLHLEAIEHIYYGESADGTTGVGLIDYVEAVEGGAQLVVATQAQWQLVKQALDQIPSDRPLSELMAENNAQIDALHTELQKHTRFFKSDMSSLLGIAITFSSGDGD
ncbi:MAG TPA: imelysin family protein [Saprospiraceae bacterium]|nr:imelysin family protein [Saprospiraceae bacterium]HMQ84392.1 imelysin family protein [Saprospiraceae bacterium]